MKPRQQPQQHTDQVPVQALWPDLPRSDLSHHGYGPANEVALHLNSYVSEDGGFLVATFESEARFKAFPGVVYGRLVSALIDCHCTWTSLHFADAAESYPANGISLLSYVTSELKFRYFKPTPFGEPLRLKSWVEDEISHEIRVLCELGPGGAVTAVGEVAAVWTENTNTEASPKKEGDDEEV